MSKVVDSWLDQAVELWVDRQTDRQTDTKCHLLTCGAGKNKLNHHGFSNKNPKLCSVLHYVDIDYNLVKTVQYVAM